MMQLPGLVNFRLCTLTDKALALAVSEKLKSLYESTSEYATREVLARHIPARPDEDFDLLVGELLYRFYSNIKDIDNATHDGGNVTKT